jgi:hypothetical protein
MVTCARASDVARTRGVQTQLQGPVVRAQAQQSAARANLIIASATVQRQTHAIANLAVRARIAPDGVFSKGRINHGRVSVCRELIDAAEHAFAFCSQWNRGVDQRRLPG